jgi:acyl-CoA synthetase (NDP forming)
VESASREVQVAALLDRARAEGRDALLEPEGFHLLAALGIRVPAQRFARDPDAIAALDLRAFPGGRVVLKVASPDLLHKTDVGGVMIVPADAAGASTAARAMAQRLAGHAIDGFTLSEYVPHADGFGGELLVGLRQTEDFGPVVMVGPGGVHAELLARHLVPGADLAVIAGGLTSEDGIVRALGALPVTRIAGGLGRGGGALIPLERLAALLRRLLEFAATPQGRQVAELEINPLALTPDGPVALDVLVTLRRHEETPAPPRPLHKLHRLLEPERIALIGVSAEGANAGRLILGNLLREGFPATRIAIVHPHADSIDGVRCYPSVAALPWPVDLCVLAVAASRVPDLVAQLIAARAAESVIVIPGGMGERSGSSAIAARVRALLDAARATPWAGPVLNGGNCLGIRSAPGRYDTTFIPEYKLAPRGGAVAPVALIAQSGAFAIARWSKLAGLDLRYLISVGNQTDLTVGDYLTYLKDDAAVGLFACYVEGFRPLDGRRWLEAAAEIVHSGRQVLLYRAARTPAGVAAGASHTAAIAGDYVVTRELARAAGVVVAPSLEDFDDFLRLFTLLGDRPPTGLRLGAVSNAGFEAVAMADNLADFVLSRLGPDTTRRLGATLTAAGVGEVVDVRQPLDLTPMLGDAAFADCVAALLADDGVDVGVIGCVPLTGALQTLPRGTGHAEDAGAPTALAHRLGRLREESRKPWVAVVDAGARYDAFAALLEQQRIPTFRTVDRALRAFGVFCRAMGARHPELPDDADTPAAAFETMNTGGHPW